MHVKFEKNLFDGHQCGRDYETRYILQLLTLPKVNIGEEEVFKETPTLKVVFRLFLNYNRVFCVQVIFSKGNVHIC